MFLILLAIPYWLFYWLVLIDYSLLPVVLLQEQVPYEPPQAPAFCAASAQAQSSRDEVARLRAERAELKSELAASREEVRSSPGNKEYIHVYNILTGRPTLFLGPD